MKKTVVFLFLIIVVLSSCSNKQKIVGTWTDIEGVTWIFSTDGKLSYTNTPDQGSREYQYSIFDGEQRTELTIFEVDYDAYIAVGITDQVYTIEFSRDGKTLRLTEGEELRGWSVAGPGMGNNQLTRQSKPVSNASGISPGTTRTDRKLNGTWVMDDGVFELRFNNGNYEQYSVDYPWVKGTYTTNRGKLITVITHVGGGLRGGDLSKWYSIDENEDENDGFTENYSINGKTLTITGETDGEQYTYTLTRK